MTDMKCPFCQQELHKDSDGYYTCYTDNCGCMKYGGNGASGSESLWLALIRTRKALDVAVGQLKKTHDYIEDFRYQETNYFLVDSKDVSIILDETNEALEQITAEQKDVK